MRCSMARSTTTRTWEHDADTVRDRMASLRATEERPWINSCHWRTSSPLACVTSRVSVSSTAGWAGHTRSTAMPLPSSSCAAPSSRCSASTSSAPTHAPRRRLGTAASAARSSLPSTPRRPKRPTLPAARTLRPGSGLGAGDAGYNARSSRTEQPSFTPECPASRSRTTRRSPRGARHRAWSGCGLRGPRSSWARARAVRRSAGW